MPRQPRIDLANIPQHVVQRGNDRQPCFFSAEDYLRYWHELREISIREDCRIHAYVFMTNHVHLLMTPSRTGQIARVMQALGRRYVRYVNDRYRRTGTLWEGQRLCPVNEKRGQSGLPPILDNPCTEVFEKSGVVHSVPFPRLHHCATWRPWRSCLRPEACPNAAP
jgi:REP element-mobilizing transposase RayT